MKKLIALSCAILLCVLGISPTAFAVSTYKYEISVVDEYGQPISDVNLQVLDANTSNVTKIWSTDDTTTGTLTTGTVVPASDGGTTFYATASSYDIAVNFRGKSYLKTVTPGGNRRITLSRDFRAVDLNTPNSGEEIPAKHDLKIPLAGDFFRVSFSTTSADQNIDRISETYQQPGRRVLLLFSGAAAGVLAIGQSQNIRTTTGTTAKGTVSVQDGTLVEAVFDGTLWRLMGNFSH